MNQVFHNPGTWVLLVLFGCMTVVLFEDSPIVAAALYVILTSYIVAAKTRSAQRLRRRGFRLRFSREVIFYEEATGGGQTRHLTFGYGYVSRRKLGIEWPNEEAWQRRMPDWAQGRREEILARVREDLGSRLADCVEVEY